MTIPTYNLYINPKPLTYADASQTAKAAAFSFGGGGFVCFLGDVFFFFCDITHLIVRNEKVHFLMKRYGVNVKILSSVRVCVCLCLCVYKIY